MRFTLGRSLRRACFPTGNSRRAESVVSRLYFILALEGLGGFGFLLGGVALSGYVWILSQIQCGTWHRIARLLSIMLHYSMGTPHHYLVVMVQLQMK